MADERAHISYALQLYDDTAAHTHFDDFKIYDLKSRQPTTDRNYINHQSLPYYALGKILQLFPNWSLNSLRYASAVVAMSGYLLYLMIGRRVQLPTLDYLLYAAFPMLTYFCGIFGSANFDSFIFLGGALLYWGCLQGIKKHARYVYCLVAGMVLVSIKLTGVLTGGIFLMLIWALMKERPRWMACTFFALVGLVCVMPYFWLFYQYGSPAPLTTGQREMLAWLHHQNPATSHWSLPHYTLNALRHFAYGQVGAASFLPVYQCVFGMAAVGLVVQAARGPFRHRTADALEILRSASCVAFVAVFFIQVIYCYPRYVQFAWFGDFYPRYYIALLPGFGLFFAQGYHVLRALLVRVFKGPSRATH
ncbi:MAG: hypothetical protein ACKVOE_05820 [Rickettsiales bacterium]